MTLLQSYLLRHPSYRLCTIFVCAFFIRHQVSWNCKGKHCVICFTVQNWWQNPFGFEALLAWWPGQELASLSKLWGALFFFRDLQRDLRVTVFVCCCCCCCCCSFFWCSSKTRYCFVMFCHPITIRCPCYHQHDIDVQAQSRPKPMTSTIKVLVSERWDFFESSSASQDTLSLLNLLENHALVDSWGFHKKKQQILLYNEWICDWSMGKEKKHRLRIWMNDFWLSPMKIVDWIHYDYLS